MNLRGDLHVHTTASDGRLHPVEVVRKAADCGLSVLAITDHDSVEGVPEAIGAGLEFPGLLVVPGVEINTDVPGTEVHILGYCMSGSDGTLAGTLRRLRDERVKRGRKMVEKLSAVGVDIDWKRVQELAGAGAVGRPHVAQAILEAGYVQSLSEAFDRYIGRKGPAYVERGKVTPEQAVRLIVEAGGFAVLAHPHSLGPEGTESITGPLVAAGLTGLEAYYDGHSRDDVEWLLAIAKRRGLLVTGGSDFHGFGGDRETPLGKADIPAECMEAFVRETGKYRPDLLQTWDLAPTR